MAMQTVVLLAGCFWGTELMLRGLPGARTTAGYARPAGSEGGANVQPTYYNLDRTGHAEAVRVDYDPDLVTLAELLALAADKSRADPSPSCAARYRRAVLCETPEQARAAAAALGADGGLEVRVGFEFHAAEPYHQGYYTRTLGL